MQVIQIHIGSAGINIGDVSWDLLRQESNLNNDGSRNEKGDVNQTFFNETINNKYTARAVFLDIDDSPMKEILQGNNKAFYQSYSIGKQSASTYARGYCTIGKQNLSSAMSVINKQIELCDKLDGFIITHSISGGVGSGFTSLIDEELQNNFQKVPKVSISVMPSPDIGNCVIAPYNAILSLNNQINNQDLTICLDNQQLYNICDNLDIECPNYNTINQLIAQVTSGLAVGYSEPKQMLLNDQVTNLIPYKMHHFVQPYIYFTQYNKDNLIKKLFQNSFSSYSKNNAKQICKTLLFRGDITYFDLFNQIQNQINENFIKQVDWAPTNSKIAVSESKIIFQEQKIKNGGFMLQNSANIAGQFEKVADDFDKLFSKRSFVFRYYLDGMEEQDFFDSRELIQAFIKDYEDLFVFDQNGEDPDFEDYD